VLNYEALLKASPVQNPEHLNPAQLRKALDFIYDGHQPTVNVLLNLHYNYRRAHRMFVWFMKNGIRGKKFCEYFQNESGDIDGGGILSGVAYVLGKIDGVKHKTLKAGELI